MKKLLSVHIHQTAIDAALLITRVGIAILMLVHGLPKLGMLLSDGPVQFPGMMGMSPEFSLTMAVMSEVACSILLLIGLGTRFAVLPLIATMLVAVLLVHSTDPFIKKELGIHYLLTYVFLFFAGSGKYSLDYWFQKKLTPQNIKIVIKGVI